MGNCLLTNGKSAGTIAGVTTIVRFFAVNAAEVYVLREMFVANVVLVGFYPVYGRAPGFPGGVVLSGDGLYWAFIGAHHTTVAEAE